MKIDNSVFNKQKVKLCNLNCGVTFLYKDDIFIRAIDDNNELCIVNLTDGQLDWISGDIEVEPIKTKLILDE